MGALGVGATLNDDYLDPCPLLEAMIPTTTKTKTIHIKKKEEENCTEIAQNEE